MRGSSQIVVCKRFQRAQRTKGVMFSPLGVTTTLCKSTDSLHFTLQNCGRNGIIVDHTKPGCHSRDGYLLTNVRHSQSTLIDGQTKHMLTHRWNLGCSTYCCVKRNLQCFNLTCGSGSGESNGTLEQDRKNTNVQNPGHRLRRESFESGQLSKSPVGFVENCGNLQLLINCAPSDTKQFGTAHRSQVPSRKLENPRYRLLTITFPHQKSTLRSVDRR